MAVGEVAMVVAGVGAITVAYKAYKAWRKSSQFFKGAKFTPKVLKQMKLDDNHGFPTSVEAFASSGKVRQITGGDGIKRDMLEIPGSYKGKNGVFEYIKEADGSINHRFFKANRTK